MYHPSSRTGKHSHGAPASSPVGPVGPGESYILPSSRFQKKAFPFITPQQAIRRNLGGQIEERARPIENETLRVIPFGGVEQVGLNCFGFEYEDEMLIVDMGLQFPDQYQFGINSSVPDLSYTKGKKVVGVAITHGHIDHIGAISILMRQLGARVPLYATPMAYELIKLKQEESKFPLSNLSEYVRYKPVQMGKHFIITPFTVDHSIPDSVGLLIETPVGRFVHTGDWKFDNKPLPNRPSTDYTFLESIGRRGVRALFTDSTNAHLLGSSISESEVVDSIEEIFTKASGRVITATFSSIVDRVILMIATSEKFGRKVVLLGRSMQNYMEIAMKLGYARPQPGTLISIEEAAKLPDDQVTICCTGAQGERYAALMRIATGESRDTSLKPTDTVIFSSSVIPGNERAVQSIYDIVTNQGVRVHHYKESEIHAGGHARAEDSQRMISLIKPEVYVPIYGFPHMLHGNARNARGMGYSDDKIVILKNGNILEFTKLGYRKTDLFVPHRLITVDGLMVGYTREDDLHDRHQMMLNGTIAIGVAARSGKVSYRTAGIPDPKILPNFDKRLRETILSSLRGEGHAKIVDSIKLAKAIEKKVEDLYFHELGKEPIVIVNIVDSDMSAASGPLHTPSSAQRPPLPPRGNRPPLPPRSPLPASPRPPLPPRGMSSDVPAQEATALSTSVDEVDMPVVSASPAPTEKAAIPRSASSNTRFVGSFGGPSPTPRPQRPAPKVPYRPPMKDTRNLADAPVADFSPDDVGI